MKFRRNQFTNKQSVPISPFDKALKYLSIRQRSVKEIRDYLVKKKYLPDDINDAIKKLVELKFLNDDDFARSFTENRQSKGKSKRAISFELKLKGVNPDISQDVLDYAKSDYKTALEYITKRIKQFQRFEKEEKQKKIIRRLRSRGYDWEIISKVIKKL